MSAATNKKIGMLLLAAFGLGLATLQGKIPSPELHAQVAGALGARTADWMHPKAERGDVAVAATKTEAPAETVAPTTSAD